MPSLLSLSARPALSRHTPAALLACITLACSFALAQTDAPKPASPNPPLPPVATQLPQPAFPSSGPILTVNFPGGTAKQFVEAVRQAADAAGGRVNVVVPKEAETITIPGISVRDVTAYTALQSLEYAVLPDAGYQFKVVRIGKSDESSATFAIQFYSRALTAQQSNPALKVETHIIAIRDLVEAPAGLAKDPSMVTSPETILNALQAASQLDVDSRVSPPEIMYHKESQLLIIRGTGDQLRTLETVVGQLKYSLESRRSEAASAADREKAARLQKAELDAQISLNSAQMKMAEAEVDRTTSAYARITELVKAGQAPSSDLDNARADMQRARAAREQATAAERNLKERQTILDARVQAGGGLVGPTELAVPATYELSDLEPFAEDIRKLFAAVVSPDRLPNESNVKPRYANTRDDRQVLVSMAVRATPAQHQILVRALNTIRRAKANEPKLPGLDADDLIRKGESK